MTNIIDIWRSVHVINTTGVIIDTNVKSKRRELYPGQIVWEVAREARKCMTVIRRIARTGQNELVDYIGTDGRRYVAIGHRVNRYLVKVNEFLSEGWDVHQTKQMIRDHGYDFLFTHQNSLGV